ncbi:MAG: iron ABC transporter permease [Chloroflexi bacterium]|nr:iron ABC transporter permease [Chloroflexota bacterium]
MRRPTGMTVLTGVVIAVIGYLLVIPLITQVLASFRGPYLPIGVPTAQWSLDNYHTLFSGAGDLANVLLTTGAYVGGAAVISTLIAWTLAWIVVRTDVPGRTVISVLVLLPFIIPPIVRAQSWVLMLAPQSGLLNQLLRALPFVGGESGPIDPFAFSTIVVVQGLVSVTFPFLLLVPIMQNMDGALEEASRTSGATAWQTLRRVTLPVLFPASLAVVLLSTILLLGSLEIPLLFGQQEGRDIFALRMWTLLRGNASELPKYGMAATYGVVFLIATLAIFRVYLWVTRDAGRRASITGKGFRPTRLALGRRRWLVLAILVAYLVPTSILPAVALLWSSLTPFAMPISLDNLQRFARIDAYIAVLQDPEFYASFARTILIAGVSSTIAVLLAMVAAWVVARGRTSWGTRILDMLASSSVAIPAVIVGFSTFLFYLVINRTIPLIGTIWILIFAYSYRISVSYRVGHAAVLQIDRSLEESAAASGASRLATFRRVVIPLLLPAMAAVWIQLFILGSHEFTLPAFLATPDTRPLAWYLYSRINPGAAQLYDPSQGAAMALLFTVVVFALAFLLRSLVNRRQVARTTVGATGARAATDPAGSGSTGTSGARGAGSGR